MKCQNTEIKVYPYVYPTHFLLLIANNTIEIIPISATGSCIQVMVSTY